MQRPAILVIALAGAVFLLALALALTVRESQAAGAVRPGTPTHPNARTASAAQAAESAAVQGGAAATAATAAPAWRYHRWQETAAGWQSVISELRPWPALTSEETDPTRVEQHLWQTVLTTPTARVLQLHARGQGDLCCWVDGRLRLVAPRKGTPIDQAALLRLEAGAHQVVMAASHPIGAVDFTLSTLDPTQAEPTPIPTAADDADTTGLRGWTIQAKGCFLADVKGLWPTAAALIADGADTGWACTLAGEFTSWTTGELELAVDFNGGVRAWIDDELVLADWAEGSSRSCRSRPVVTEPGRRHRLRFEFASAKAYGSWRLGLAGTHIPAQPFPMWALRPLAPMASPTLPATLPNNPWRRGLLDPVALARQAGPTETPWLMPPAPQPIGAAEYRAREEQLWYRATPATAEEVLGAVHLAMVAWSQRSEQLPPWPHLATLALAADPGLGVEVARWWWCLADEREADAAARQVLLAHAWWGTRHPGTIVGAFDWRRPFITIAPLPVTAGPGSWMALVNGLLTGTQGADQLQRAVSSFGQDAPLAQLRPAVQRAHAGSLALPEPDPAVAPVFAFWRAPTAAMLKSLDDAGRRALVDAYGRVFPFCAEATVNLLWHLLTVDGWCDTRCDVGALMWSGICTAQHSGDVRTVPIMAWMQESCLDPAQPSGSRYQYVVEAGKYALPAMLGQQMPSAQVRTLLPLFERSADLGRVNPFEPGRHLRPWAARAWWDALAAAGAHDELAAVLADDAVDPIAEIRRDAAVRLAGLLVAGGQTGQAHRLLERTAAESQPSDLSLMALTDLMDAATRRGDATAFDRGQDLARRMLTEVQNDDRAGLAPRLLTLLGRSRP